VICEKTSNLVNDTGMGHLLFAAIMLLGIQRWYTVVKCGRSGLS